jgi:hypothetical protein
MRISDDQLEVSNIFSFINLKAEYYGAGLTTTSPVAYVSGTQNIILAYPFYDKGLYAYSAATFSIITASTSSDTFEAAIYTSQLIPGAGLFPHTPIISGMTVTTTPIGNKTYTFPSNISMSGYGGGVYWMVFKISNSGVTPTVRFANSNTLTPLTNIVTPVLGFTQSFGGAYGVPYRLNGSNMVLSGQTTFDNPFSATINTTQSSNAAINGPSLGFVLHTV